MMTIVYSRDATPVADEKAMEYAKSCYGLYRILPKWCNYIGAFTASNAVLIDAYRVLVYRGDIPCDEIQFLYDGKYIRIDSNARFERLPEGFRDVQSKFLEELLLPRIELTNNRRCDY